MLCYLHSIRDFNSRSRVGSDLVCCKKYSKVKIISIHAPVWGATLYLYYLYLSLFISIHAPVWGATLIAKDCDAEDYISIHAPVWGATIC